MVAFLASGGRAVGVLGLALEDVDDGAQKTSESLLAEGRNPQTALTRHRPDGGSTRGRVQQRQLCYVWGSWLASSLNEASSQL